RALFVDGFCDDCGEEFGDGLDIPLGQIGRVGGQLLHAASSVIRGPPFTCSFSSDCLIRSSLRNSTLRLNCTSLRMRFSRTEISRLSPRIRSILLRASESSSSCLIG